MGAFEVEFHAVEAGIGEDIDGATRVFEETIDGPGGEGEGLAGLAAPEPDFDAVGAVFEGVALVRAEGNARRRRMEDRGRGRRFNRRDRRDHRGGLRSFETLRGSADEQCLNSGWEGLGFDGVIHRSVDFRFQISKETGAVPVD